MELLSFACPWCGESNELPLDPGEFGQQVVTDCSVCCRPIEIDMPADGESPPAIRGEGQ